MYNIERKRQILDILIREKRSSVRDLARVLYVSEATVRRDLNFLAKEGKIQKAFGGAVICEQFGSDIPFSVRRQHHLAEKQQICKAAAALVAEGMTVFLDASSTTEALVPYLRSFHELQVVTNNPRIPLLLTDSTVSVYSTGGILNHASETYWGHFAEAMIDCMNADIVFFAARGFREDGQITDSSQTECHIKQRMIARARQSCFLCDSEKIGRSYLFTVAQAMETDYVFSETELPQHLLGKRQREGF